MKIFNSREDMFAAKKQKKQSSQQSKQQIQQPEIKSSTTSKLEDVKPPKQQR